MIANWKLALIVICILPCIGAQGYAQMMFLKGFSSDAKVEKKLYLIVSIKI
jgi:ATP-binding cassette, subfamily B (MDR/TAP), member 1